MKLPHMLHIDDALVDNAVTLWRTGQLVAFPTETVYGLGADATHGEAVARIYAAKSRPQFNPLIIHVADARAACRYVEWTDGAETLADAFWPGPLTLVLKRRPRSRISELVSAGGDTLARRVPAHPVAQQLLQAFNGAIAAPSANRSGRVSPTMAQHVMDELGDVLPLIIDGGPCAVGVESTVLDLSGEGPVLLRPGSVTREMLNGVLSRESFVVSDSQSTLHDSRLKSPGMLASHYAPALPVRLNAITVNADEALLAFGPQVPAGAARTLNLSETGDVIEAAANLFAHLRALDDAAFRAIAVMPIPADGVGEAINDRLKRAAVR
jgi:L-threonylcarbamoyladenylate synthase